LTQIKGAHGAPTHNADQGLDLATVSGFTLALPFVFQELLMNQTFTVTGMTCGHCEKSVTQAIKTVDPKAQVVIDRSQNRVDVASDLAREKFVAAIVEEGYAVAA
jgi:copper chaperone